MSSEILAVPEEHLAEVIDFIRSGLETTGHVTPEVREALLAWCDEEEDYLKRLQEDA